MGTVIRPELSKKNKYWVDKHHYYELKHFCLQYPLWKKIYSDIDGFKSRVSDLAGFSRPNTPSDSTAKSAEVRLKYRKHMETIEQVAKATDPYLADYILKAVTEELSYTYLKSRLNIPCGKDTYYDRYRRFFWLLSKIRN